MKTTFRLLKHDNGITKPFCLTVQSGDTRLEVWCSVDELKHLIALSKLWVDDAYANVPMFGDGEPI